MLHFIDISSYQALVMWPTYASWSRIAAIKASEGVGFVDPMLRTHQRGALSAGIPSIWYYHYGRPGLGNTPQAEAAFLWQTVGSNLRETDQLVLDLEDASPLATSGWALAYLQHLELLRGVGSCPPPLLYGSDAYLRARMQDPRLAHYPLWYARWTDDPTALPPCPLPWTSYVAVQYSDHATGIPGVSSPVDVSLLTTKGEALLMPPTTTGGGENAVFVEGGVSQLEPHETEEACVAFAGANIALATAPGTPNPHTAEQVDQLADTWYARFTGSITSAAGLSVEQLHTMLTGLHLAYEPIPIGTNGPANDEAVRAALRLGKLVIICAAEDSFTDMALGRPPYSWNTRPYNHAIVASGLITSGPYSGNVWVRDTVAVSGGYPASTKRPYALAPMQYVSLTAVTPSWLTKGPSPMPTPPPHGWTDDGTILKAPNGHTLVAGFRAHVLSAVPPWPPGDQPLEEEHHVAVLEQGYTQTPADGQQQLTMYRLLCFNAVRGVYEASLGREFQLLRDQLTALEAELAALKALPVPTLSVLQALLTERETRLTQILALATLPSSPVS